MTGPLTGIRVIEMEGIGPAPFCGMMLADMGADVLRISRNAPPAEFLDLGAADVLSRGRCEIKLDLKSPEDIATLLQLVEGADMLIEGFRPGVMERLGLGPDICHARNPALVYGRVTGWGQHGPFAQSAGHDINYIALSGALSQMGHADQPLPPLNLLGDFAGGAMLLAFGLVCAALEANSSGKGQVVDAAMTDGAALLMAMTYGFKAAGRWSDQRGENWPDGNGAPFYTCYRCADGKWISIGALEPKFHALLYKKVGLEPISAAQQWDQQHWPARKNELEALFAMRPREEWCAILEMTDACFAPVLDLEEAPTHPHNLARNTFVKIDDVVQPAPAPRFSRTPAALRDTGPDLTEVLLRFGLRQEDIAILTKAGPCA